MKKIVIYTTSTCADCIRTKYFLKSNDIVFTEVNIEEEGKSQEYVRSVNDGMASVPTVVITENDIEVILPEPTNQELEEALFA